MAGLPITSKEVEEIAQVLPRAIIKAIDEAGEWRVEQFPPEYVSQMMRLARDVGRGPARVAANMHFTFLVGMMAGILMERGKGD